VDGLDEVKELIDGKGLREDEKGRRVGSRMIYGTGWRDEECWPEGSPPDSPAAFQGSVVLVQDEEVIGDFRQEALGFPRRFRKKSEVSIEEHVKKLSEPQIFLND
jgi:hypothetical protein